MRTSWELRVRRTFGVFAFSAVAVSLAGDAGALGIAFVVLILAPTSLFFVLNRHALGKPGILTRGVGLELPAPRRD